MSEKDPEQPLPQKGAKDLEEEVEYPHPTNIKVEDLEEDGSESGWDIPDDDEDTLNLFSDSNETPPSISLIQQTKINLNSDSPPNSIPVIPPKQTQLGKKSKVIQKEEFIKNLKNFGEKFGKTVLKVGSALGKGVVQVGTVVGKGVVQVGSAVGKGVVQAGEKIGEEIEGRKFRNEQIKEELKRMHEEEDKNRPKFSFKYKEDTQLNDDNDVGHFTDLLPSSDSSSSMASPLQSSSETVIFTLMDEEMRQAYNDAIECLQSEQESMALHYYEFILNRAKDKSLTSVCQFISTKIQQLYQ